MENNSIRNMENQPSSSTSVAEFKCAHCNKTFGRPKNLNQHIARIHNSQRYKCDECGALLSSGFRLKTHLAVVHKKKNKINFVKSHLVTKRSDGYDTSPEAKKYIIREQADQIRRLEANLAKSNNVIENLRKKIAAHKN